MERQKLYDSEYRFMKLIWANEPIGSGALAALCKDVLGWKKSTTYTVLKKLGERGILKNENTIVSSLISESEVQQYESNAILEKSFSGSLPQFVAAFLKERTLSAKEAEEIRTLIDTYSQSNKEK